MASESPTSPPAAEATSATTRRGFLSRMSGAAMGVGLLAGYGSFAQYALRFLYPPEDKSRQWMFVARADELAKGDSQVFKAPTGEPINITRQGSAGDVSDFIALSSTCPHLGCQVHWEAHNTRFFCPCHNGVFDPSGVATEGPPADAGQSLPQYPLKIAGGLLFIEVPTERLAATGPGGARGGRSA